MNSSDGERSGRRPSDSGSARPCRGAAAPRGLPVPPHLSRPRVPRDRPCPAPAAAPRPRPAAPSSANSRSGTSRSARCPPLLPENSDNPARTSPPPEAPSPGPAGAARTCPGVARDAPARRGPAAAAPRRRSGRARPAARPRRRDVTCRCGRRSAPRRRRRAALRRPPQPSPARPGHPPARQRHRGRPGAGARRRGRRRRRRWWMGSRARLTAFSAIVAQGSGLRGPRTPRPVPPRSTRQLTCAEPPHLRTPPSPHGWRRRCGAGGLRRGLLGLPH